MIEVEVWADIVCPWCYLGNVRLKKAVERLDGAREVEVRTRSFELNPEAGAEPVDNIDYLVEKFGVSRDEAIEMDSRLADLAKAEGVPFTIGRPSANSFDLHRVVWLAREYELGEQLFDELQFSLFGEAANVFDHEVLVAKSGALGIPEERVREVLASDAVSDFVRADEAQAKLIGISGVPFAAIDHKYAIPGAASVDQYYAVLSGDLPTVT
ncbi:MAG: DsbA family oxidoreductase [Solirubrobacterales bacterium]